MNTPAKQTPAKTKARTPAKTDNAKSIKGWLNSEHMETCLKKSVGRSIDHETFQQAALTALQTTPKLLECSQVSVLNSVLVLAQFGLKANGRDAHLIPYGRECQLIIDYKGYVKLALRSGLITDITARVVKAGDVFQLGPHGSPPTHVPWFMRNPSDRPATKGETVGVYVVVTHRNSFAKVDWMDREEIEEVRDKYGARDRQGNLTGPWVSNFDEMAKKTLIRRISKTTPLGADFDDLVAIETGMEQSRQEAAVVDAKVHVPGVAGLEQRLAETADMGAESMLSEREPDQDPG